MTKSLLKKAENHISSGSKAEDYRQFLKTFYENVPEDDVAMMAPDSLAHTAQNHKKLSEERKIGKEPAISVSTPTLRKNGWEAGRTIIDIVNDDMAFLVDSVVAEIISQRYQISIFIHPILHVELNTKSKIKKFYAKPIKNKTTAQSHIHIELNRVLSAAQCDELETRLKHILKDARLANRDWRTMRSKIKEAKKAIKTAPSKFGKNLISEYEDFLDYLYDNNFTFLGYREYKFTNGKNIKSKIIDDSSLGLLSDERQPVYINEARKSLTETQQKLRIKQEPLTLSKVNRHSTVHRHVPIDSITVKKYNNKGDVVGEILFLGLFTSVTYSRSVEDIPLIRLKVDNVIKKSRFASATHNYKALRHILEKYPRDEILQMPEKLLYEHSISILRLQERPQIALYMRVDPFGRYISALVYVPRDKYETKLRMKLQNILVKRLGGKCDTFKVQQDDSPLARVIFQINVNALNTIPKFDVDELEQELIEAGQNWSDLLKEAIEDNISDSCQAADMIRDYSDAFPTSYQENYAPVQAVLDIEKIDSIIDDNQIALELYEERAANQKEIHLKLYNAKTELPLSDVLPIMENMGLNVITERPFEIEPSHFDHAVWIHDFLIEADDPTVSPDVAKIKKAFEDVFKRTWNLQMESDSLNMLAFYSNMPWQDITILRSYIHYLRQTGVPFSLPYIETAITTYPDIAEKLVSFFKELFDPSNTKLSDQQKKNRVKSIHKALNKVEALDHDRIFRQLIILMTATLRTNFFQTDENGNQKTRLCFKLDSEQIPFLPNPKPYREIFVYSARVEGVHLRGDKIARGGLRWSDRHEDFRTEVLGLMKAQQVKNAIIVPMGAKGGFVVKNSSAGNDRAALHAEGIECYKTFIRGLLDITDNRKGSDIIPPDNVVRYDEDDPYFVVAADKGTATFSDIANGISEEYGFWLADAFASGGSAGYDHKKMGITARGAWESVKRHFRELNHDTQTQDFDVVGVGDMAGDVFGNGMLLSEHIRLIGAFNHLHIFCDPEPDATKTFAERKRLFEEVKGWGDYNEKILSEGGRIFSRKEKSLKLTPEIQARFDIEESELSPNQLIRAMLKARTDLLWFGGIGTYIKATSESNADVGDKGNDSLRLNAPEIRAKVIGEGANLAITQAARIEYAQHGGHLNADYIDNAGGVASSDDEVNIKILLGDVMRKAKHKMDIKKRNKLLESMTEDVSKHVLRGNYQQAQGISLMELQAADQMAAHGRLIDYLRKEVGLSRTLENLPFQEEIDQRIRQGKGLTKPELSVLQSYAKIAYTADLLNSDIPESKAMEERLFRYFPKKLSKGYPKEVLNHRLRREIIATTLAGGIVNRMGPDFIRDRMESCGASCEEVARAYIIVREAFGLRRIWDEIESLDGQVPAIIQLRALQETARMTERAVTWFLTRYGRKLEITRDIENFEGGIEAVKKNLNDVVPKELLEKINLLTKSGIENGLPKNLARDISLMPILGSACDIIRISVDHKFDIPQTASVYFELGGHFHLDWMRQKARHLPADNQWSAQALEGLVDQLYTCQAGLTIQILKDMAKLVKSDAKQKGSILDHWINERGEQARLMQPLFDELRETATLDMSMIIIAEQRLRNLYGG
jgi:glutamate dehydrogenase